MDMKENMGHVHVNVKVLNLELSVSEEVRLLVDTGSTYTWIPEETLERVGIRRERVREFVTIEGKLVRRNIGMGIVELLGERAPTVLVFTAEGDANVLGIHALEGLGLEYDPVRMELRKVKAISCLSAFCPRVLNVSPPRSFSQSQRSFLSY